MAQNEKRHDVAQRRRRRRKKKKLKHVDAVDVAGGLHIIIITIIISSRYSGDDYEKM